MKFFHSEKDETLMSQSSFLGTPEYISPEMLFNNVVGPECDLWAVGKT